MNAVIDPKEFDAAQAAAAKAAAAADPYTYTHKLQKPLDYEGKHYESLTFNWGKLTGNDSIAIEAELTALNQPVITPLDECGLPYPHGLAGRVPSLSVLMSLVL